MKSMVNYDSSQTALINKYNEYNNAINKVVNIPEFVPKRKTTMSNILSIINIKMKGR
jgi:hypothetical protein